MATVHLSFQPAVYTTSTPDERYGPLAHEILEYPDSEQTSSSMGTQL